MNCKPNFLIIGAAKAATTSLSSMLSLHPQAAIVRTKEPHFFSDDMNYDKGWDWYQSLYNHSRKKKAIGDASTSYSRLRRFPNTIPRLKKHLGDIKIIYMVRHPLERIVSAYLQLLSERCINPMISSVNEAVERNPVMVDSCRYWEVFDAYRTEFGEPNIKVVWFEEFSENPQRVFTDVCRFLCIDTDFQPPPHTHQQNSKQYVLARLKKQLKIECELNVCWEDTVRQSVIETLRDDNVKLLQHFDKPPNHWNGLFSV